MKNIDKIIKMKVLEILFVLCILVIACTVWLYFLNSDAYRLLNEKQPNSYAYIDTIHPPKVLIQVGETLSNSLRVVNDTYLDMPYSLGVQIAKNSSVNYSSLNISFHNNVSKLNEYYYGEDDTFYYFLLEKGNLVATSIPFEIFMWLDDSTSVTQGSLRYDFVNLENM